MIPVSCCFRIFVLTSEIDIFSCDAISFGLIWCLPIECQKILSWNEVELVGGETGSSRN